MEVRIKNNGELVDATIEMVDGVMVVSPKEVKVDVSQFKDGDVITCGHEFYHWTCILRGEIERITDNMFIEDYCGINSDGTYYLEPADSDSATYVRYATEEEKQKLFDKLAEEGYEWDAENRQLVKLKWEPILGDKYWKVCYEYFTFRPDEWAWQNCTCEKEAYNKGLVFKTEDECQAFCDRLNDAINSVKP